MCIFNLQILGTAFNHYWVIKYIDSWCGSYMCGINKIQIRKGWLSSVAAKRYTVNGCCMQLWSSILLKARFFQLIFSETLKNPKIHRNIRILQHIIWRKELVESPVIAKATVVEHCANYFIIFQETSALFKNLYLTYTYVLVFMHWYMCNNW